MKKFTAIMAIACLCSTSMSAHADGPIFLNKLKATFSKSKPVSTKKAPSKPQKKASTQPQISQGVAPPAMAGRRQMLSAANQRSEIIRQESIQKSREELAKRGLSDPNIPALNSTTAGTQQQSQKKKIIIRNAPTSKEGSGPKPIFKNFR